MSYAALSMGLFIFILAYFIFNAPQTPGQPIETNVETSQFCQTADEATAPTFKAPADNADKIGSKGNTALGIPIFNPDCKSDGPNHQFSYQPTTYRLIRKNVPLSKTDINHHNENFTGHSCHFDTAEELGIDIPEVDKTKYKVFFPQIAGEINLNRTLPSRTRGGEGEKTLMYFIDYGLVFLLHINPDGSYTELKGGTTEGEAEDFVLADVYQDIESPGRGGLPDEALSCDTTRGEAIARGPHVTVPQPSASLPPDQLQLQYFVFGSNAGSSEVVNGWGIHCKPAIYLYPPEKKLVNVKVTPQGYLSYTDPPYNPISGWTVWANPDGKLQSINDERLMINDYLYFESKIRDEVIKKPTQGWVRPYNELADLYKEILPELGLNAQQQNDFIEYWTKALPQSPYYFVGIIDQDNVNQFEKLEITPKPDSINRVRVYFERLDSPKVVEEPVVSAEDRKLTAESEFKVVEWGGMVKNDPNHPFTCSQ